MRPRLAPIAMIAAMLYAFMYLPLVMIVTASFNSARLGVQWRGFTLEWYRTALTDPQILTAIKNTLIVASVSTLVSTALGTMLAYGLARHEFKGRRFVAGAFLLPVAVPDIVLAVGLLLFYSLVRQWTGLFQLGFATMIVAHITFQIPFVSLVVASRLRGFDRSLEEAASDLGASRWQRLSRVTLPLLAPGILAGALLAFTLSLDDFVTSFFTSGPGTATLPVYIFSSVKRGVSAEVHALSSLLIFAAILGSIGVTFFQRPPMKRG
jgi:spermidine/putrescine transport system permease protein